MAGGAMYQLIIVDDEKAIAEGISALFPWNKLGFEAVSFTDPRIALSYIRSHGADVVLSDIEMPGMSGIELCRELQGEDVLIVFLSSHQNYDYFRSAIQYSVEDYLLKPIGSGDLLECFGKIKTKLDGKYHVEAAEQTSETNDVVRMTADLADILKYALTDPLQPITLEEEIGYLKKYIAIQHLRFGERFIIYYEVDERILQAPVFRLMLQPIIENSILHGIRYREGTGYIKLTVFERDGWIRFRVFDTGAGMSAERLKELRENINTFNVRNIGLANVNNRLKLYFGDEAGLKICSIEGQGTIVKFEIPKDKMQKYVTKSKIM